MTVSTEISSNEYTGNGVTTDFDYKFRIFKANQLSVIKSDADGDNVVALRLGTDYTVTGANKSAGGKVILTKPLANGHKISIARDIPIKQETSFRNQGKFLAETHEDAFDYLTMIIQRIWGSLGSLYLKRPNILSSWFDAKGYRIANLGKPKRDSDAVDLGTLKDEIEGVNSTILKKEKRTLRVDDIDISSFPKASARRNKQIGFDSSGIPTLLDPAETGALGYIFIDSFEKGALITTRYQALHFEGQGEYYRWDGDLPKTVPAGSTPQSTGGIGKGAWVSVGDASLREDLRKGMFISNYTSIYYVPNVEVNELTDNRDAIYAFKDNIYIPLGVTVRCNLLPDDDITIFKGEGTILTRDLWGNEHVFDVALANKLTQAHSVKSKVNSILLKNLNPRIGVVGDSITDGRAATSWVPNPTDSAGNLKSTDYDHDANGGKNGYFAIFRDISKHATGLNPNRSVETFNASSSGKKLIDGWAYRNIDYGFFQNKAYKNKVPDVVFLAMGHNDGITSEELVQQYLAEFDKFIQKCKGYGSYVALLTTSMCATRNDHTEAFKDAVMRKYGIEWIDLATPLIDYAFNGNSTLADVYYTGPNQQDYDFTHPNQAGHRFMAHQFLNKLFDSRVTTFDNSGVIGAIRTARHISYDATSRTEYNTITLNLDDQQYLKDVAGVSRCTAPANPCFDFLIENKVIGGSLNIIIPKPSPQSKPAKLILLNGAGKYEKDISGFGSELDGYYVMRVPQLDYGPNIVRVYYSGSGGIQGYAPFLSVTKTSKTSSLSPFNADIRNDSMIPITIANSADSFHRDAYNYTIGSRIPDRVSEPYEGYISIKAKFVQGMRIWIVRKPDISAANGYYVELTSATTLTVKDASDAVVTSLTGLDIGTIARFNIRFSGNTMYLQINAKQSTAFNRKGGLMYIENKTGSNVADYFLDVSMSFNG